MATGGGRLQNDNAPMHKARSMKKWLVWIACTEANAIWEPDLITHYESPTSRRLLWLKRKARRGEVVLEAKWRTNSMLVA